MEENLGREKKWRGGNGRVRKKTHWKSGVSERDSVREIVSLGEEVET